MRASSFLSMVLVAGSFPVSAQAARQGLKPGLAFVPATVEAVTVIPDPAAFEAKRLAFAQALGIEADKDLPTLPEVGFGLADLGPGAILSAEYPTPKPKRKEGAGAKPTPEVPPAEGPLLAVMPVLHPEPLLARLQAKRQGEVWAYALKGKGDQPLARFAAVRPGFLIVSNDLDKLQAALSAKQTLAPEMSPEAESWVEAQDAAIFVSAQETAQDLADMVKGMKAKKGGQPNPLDDRFGDIATQAQASVDHFALGFRAGADGSVQAAFHAFFRPSSPLSKRASALSALGNHPLAGLPQDPYALAFGGLWPDALSLISTRPETALLPFKGHELPEKTKAAYLAALEAQAHRTDAMAMLIGPPGKAGEPFFKNTVAVLRVKDSQAFLKGQAEVVSLQRQLAKAAGLTPFTTFEPDALPDTPSFSLSTDLSAASSFQAAPQTSMVTTFLFGGTSIHQCYAQLDDHRWLFVFGTPEDMKWALLRAKQNGALSEEVMLKREDGLLAADSRFNLYVDLKGMRDFGQAALSAFGKDSEPLPEVPHVPPFGFSFTFDAAGFEAMGGARPETLKAMKALFEGIKSKLPARQPAPPPAKD